ncbi:unnamed protein product, partial [Prorocentrum cordatum]
MRALQKETAEKEVSSIQDEVRQFEQQLANARERLANKQEQLSIAKSREQELKAQGVGDPSQGFLEAMQKRYEKAVDGSGVSPVECQQLFAQLGKVMANAKEDLGAGVAESSPNQNTMDPSLLKMNRIGSSKVERLKGPAMSKISGGSKSAPAWPSARSSGRGVPNTAHNQKKYDKLTAWTFNGSGWGTIEEKLGEKVHGASQCYAVQEHHLADDKWPVVTQAMKAQGYRVGGAAAASTAGAAGEAGSSAGVAVAAPRQRRGGVAIASMYLWTAGGMSYRNRELVSHVAGQLETLGAPWIIGGDFRVKPDILAEVGSLKIAKACVIAPNAACGARGHAHGTSEIDYFIAPGSVKAQVEGARAQGEWPFAPHEPACITIKLKVVERRARALEKPKPVPELQIGCAPAPPSHQQVGPFDAQGDADQEWARCMRKLEQEAFAISGTVRDEEGPRAGRSEIPTWKIKPLTLGGGNLPEAAGQAIWWRWLSRSLRNLKGARAKLRATTEHWGKRAGGQGAARRDKLQELCQEAAARSEETDQRLAKERGAKRAEKLEAAAAGSAGGLRELSKPAAVWRPRRADSMAESADPLEAAELALKKWKAVWRTDDPMQQQGASDGARETLLAILREVEKTLARRVDMGTVLFCMAPKTFTTDRATGLLPTTIRIWGIMREPYMQRWVKAAEDAAWGALLSHEMDDPDVQDECTEAAITAILDLATALERVSLFVLREAGRRLMASEPVSSEASTVTTIIAGSKLSVSFLKMVIQSTSGGLVVERRQQQRIVEEFMETLHACFEGFDKLGLEFSVGGRGAKSPTLQLAAAQEEPTFEVTEAPIVQWARAVWHAEQRPSIYTDSEVQHLGLSSGAVIMSLKRADWAWPAWRSMRTKEGHVLNLREVCPMDVAAMMRRDIQTKLCEEWTKAPEYSSLEPAPCIAPSASQFKAKGFSKHAKSAAKKVFIGGSWTMSKLCESDIAPTDICSGCGNAVGTPRHRLCKCEALRQQRLEAQADWQRVAEQQDQCQGAAFEGDDDTFTGDIACDGPKLGYAERAQTGWAAMSINEDGKPKVQLWGPQPCTLPVRWGAKRAETRAFLKALENALPPFRIYADHAGTIDGLKTGERRCTSWKRPHADLRRRIWRKVKDADLDVSTVFHVEAHRARARIAQLQGGELKIAKGNGEVDLLAKAGAGLDANFGKQQALGELGARARWAAQNIGWRCQKMNGE